MDQERILETKDLISVEVDEDGGDLDSISVIEIGIYKRYQHCPSLTWNLSRSYRLEGSSLFRPCALFTGSKVSITSLGTDVEANEDCDSRSWKSSGLSLAATASPDAYLRPFLPIDAGVDRISLLENRHKVDGNSRKAMLSGYMEGYVDPAVKPLKQQYRKISREMPYFRASGTKVFQDTLLI